MAVGSVGKRKAERRDCHVKAQVQFDDGRKPLDCVILNFSATGARATLLAAAELPARFKLFIPSRPETKQVLLRWRSALEFGIEYSTGIADENAVFDLMARVIKLEDAARGGALAAPQAAASVADETLLQRIAEIEAKLSAPPASAPDVIERLALLEQDRTTRDALADLGPAPVETDPALLRRIAELEAKMAAAPAPAPALAPEFVDRLQRLEEALMAREAHVDHEPAPTGPDPILIRRIADIEAKLMAPRAVAPAPAALDLAPLENRIESVSRTLTESLTRTERFLNARLEEIEAGVIAAPAPPSARGGDLVAIERRLLDVEQALREPVAIDGLEAIDARLSNLEMSLLEVRDALATPPQSNVGADLAERIAGLERRNEDVTDALRSVLAMLTARKDMRATG